MHSIFGNQHIVGLSHGLCLVSCFHICQSNNVHNIVLMQWQQLISEGATWSTPFLDPWSLLSMTAIAVSTLVFKKRFDQHTCVILLNNATGLKPMIWGSHHYSYIYADKHLNLPIPVAFGPWRPPIKSVHCLIQETDINKSSLNISFSHYVNLSSKTVSNNTHPMPSHSNWLH